MLVKNTLKNIAAWLLAALIYLAAAHTAEAQTGGGFPPSPKPIICLSGGCSAAALKVGQSIYAYKTTGTNRSSTTTLTADADLTITNIPTGRYALAMVISMTVTTTTTQGFEYDTGTGTVAPIGGCVLQTGSTTASSATGSAWLANGGVGVALPAAFWTANTTQTLFCQGSTLSVTGPGAWTLSWAQNVSNANATTVGGSSYMAMTRLQ